MRVLDKARQTAQRTAGKTVTQADRGPSATVAATTNCSGISAPPTTPNIRGEGGQEAVTRALAALDAHRSSQPASHPDRPATPPG
jgi:hypothetical protein